jgi:hypothetical protein
MPTSAPQPDWPDDLDAMIAAPQYHSVMLENDSVLVLDTMVPLAPHTLENIGESNLQVISIELKQAQ